MYEEELLCMESAEVLYSKVPVRWTVRLATYPQ